MKEELPRERKNDIPRICPCRLNTQLSFAIQGLEMKTQMKNDHCLGIALSGRNRSVMYLSESCDAATIAPSVILTP